MGERQQAPLKPALTGPSSITVARAAFWVEVNLGDGAVEVGAGFRERAAALGDSTGAPICRCGVTVACGLFVVGGHHRPVGFSRGTADQRVGSLGV